MTLNRMFQLESSCQVVMKIEKKNFLNKFPSSIKIITFSFHRHSFLILRTSIPREKKICVIYYCCTSTHTHILSLGKFPSTALPTHSLTHLLCSGSFFLSIFLLSICVALRHDGGEILQPLSHSLTLVVAVLLPRDREKRVQTRSRKEEGSSKVVVLIERAPFLYFPTFFLFLESRSRRDTRTEWDEGTCRKEAKGQKEKKTFFSLFQRLTMMAFGQ